MNTETRRHLSRELIDAVKLSPKKKFELARAIDVSPSKLSGWLSSSICVQAGDARVLQLAQMLGVPLDRAFAAVPSAEEYRRKLSGS